MSSSYSSSREISLFVYSFRGGGAEKMMVKLANELHRRENNVEIILVRASGPYEPLVDPTLPVTEIGGRNTLEIQYNLWQYLRKSDTDVLLSTMEIPNIVSAIATRTVSTSVVLRIASVHSKRGRKGKYRLIPLLKRLIYPRAESIVAISDYVGQDVVKTDGVTPEKVTTIYNPAFSPEIPEKARKPVDHDWLNDPEKQVVITVGNMKPAKDFPTLISAISRLQDQDDIHLVLLGEGGGKDQLVELAKDLEIRNRISFPGFVDNPYAYMAKADVFALSSAWEGFGNVIVEAMACETPVVCTDCPGGPAEILDDGTYGPLVPVGDDTAMAQAIQKMLDDPTDPDLLASRARDFTIEKIVDQYEEELLSVAKQ